MSWPESWYLHQSAWLNSTRDVHGSGLSSTPPMETSEISSRRNLKEIFQPSQRSKEGSKNPAKDWRRRQLIDMPESHGSVTPGSMGSLSSVEYSTSNSSNYWQVGVAFAYEDMYVSTI